MKTRISKVVSSCYHQLRRIRQVRGLVGQDMTQQLVSAFISRLDYCNLLLSHLPGSTIQPLQHVMNAAARIIMNLLLRDHVKPALKQLHWLHVEQRITYNLCLFMHCIHPHRTSTKIPVRLCVHSFCSQCGRYRLRSAGSAFYVLKRTRTSLYLDNMASSTPFRPPGTLLHPTFTTLLTPVHSENDSRVYCLMMLITDYCWRSCSVV